MKAISIRQPWASLIINGYKEYEFRSWKTNFRGECLIHASQSVEEDMIDRFKCLDLEYPVGKIIGSVNITDCINIDKSFEDDLINKDELVYGDSRNRAGYAFKVKPIKKFDVPFKAKGQLGFWNYYTEDEIMEKMNDIEYGWIDISNNKHLSVDESFPNTYKLQSPKTTIENNIGVCWDQVELERFYFKNLDLNIRTYFICYYGNDSYPSHTFLTYEKDNKFYWFEHSMDKYKGIHEFDSIEELLRKVREAFIIIHLDSGYVKDDLLIREYVKPKIGISMIEFYHHCEINSRIDIDNLTK